MDRPNQVPQWATNPPDPGNVETPPLAAQRIGWQFRDKMPFQWVNWLWNQVSAWLGHYSQTSSVFKRLEDAVNAPVAAPLQLGATCLVDEDDGGVALNILDEITIDSLVGNYNVRDVAATATGVFVVVSEDGASVGTDPVLLKRLNRDGTESDVTYSTNGIVGDTKLWADGDIVVLASYNLIECWDYATGALLWSKNLSNDLSRHVTADTLQVYVTNKSEVYAYRRRDGDGGSAGDLEWVHDHGESVWAIACNGETVFVLGMSGGATDSLQAIRARDGSIVWTQDPDSLNGISAGLACDGPVLYLTRTKSIVPDVHVTEARRALDGEVSWSVDPDDGGMSLAVDQDYLWRTRGAWELVDKQTGHVLGINAYIVGGSPVLATSIASDGAALWVGLNANANGVHLLKVARGNRIRHWRRVDPTNPDHAGHLVPLAQELVPA